MKRLLTIALFLAAIQLHAATVVTVNWAASQDNGFGLANGTPLAVGNEIRLGVFDFADNLLNAEVQSRIASGNLVDLMSHFILFDTAHIGDALPASGLQTIPLAQRGGLFEKSSGAITVPDNSALFGKELFMWVFKTTGDNAPTSNFSNVTQTGVFSSTLSSWLFPSNSGQPQSLPIELTNLTSPNDSTVAGTARVVSGSFGTSTATLATGSTKVFELTTVTVIPEPTSASLLLVLLGGASFYRPSRRRD